jgi:hypothetical protein
MSKMSKTAFHGLVVVTRNRKTDLSSLVLDGSLVSLGYDIRADAIRADAISSKKDSFEDINLIACEPDEPQLREDFDTDTEVRFRCLLVGLPHTITNSELKSFLDPYATNILNFHIIHQATSTYVNTCISDSVKASACAVVEFQSGAIAASFVSLYNNLHLPGNGTNSGDSTSHLHSYSLVPILVIALAWVKNRNVIFANNAIISNSCLLELPCCAVCLRRLDVTYSHINGAEDIPVSLKFADHCDECNTCAIYGAYIRYDDENENGKGGMDIVAESINSVQGLGLGQSQQDEVTTTTSSIDIDINIDVAKESSGEHTQSQMQHLFASIIAEKQQHRNAARKTLPWLCCGVNNESATSCGLAENIWVCMVCSYTGCGRYANQHAKEHGQLTGHTFSFELVTGRIWGYCWDTFVHSEGLLYEDIYLDATSNTNTNNVTYSNSHDDHHTSSSFSAGEINAENTNNMYSSPQKHVVAAGSSDFASGTYAMFNMGANTGNGIVTGTGIVSHLDGSSEYGSLSTTGDVFSLRSHRTSRMRMTNTNTSTNNANNSGLASDVVVKMDTVTQEYEALLENQLQEQRLFFEKLLAQETVKALERAYLGNNSTSNKADSYSNQHKEVGNFSRLGSDARLSDKDRDKEKYVPHAADSVNDKLFQQIEEKKITTSLVEQQHQGLLAELREVESMTRTKKKDNEAVIRRLKGVRQSDADCIQRIKKLEQRYSEQEDELKQTLRDLGFYLDTLDTVNRSHEDVKNEIQQGTLEVYEKKK